MLRLSDNFRYFFCHESVSLKYRHNGLGCYVKNELHRDPLNGDVYIFMSKDQKTLRAFYYYNKKLILTEAKLLEGKFPRPVFDVHAKAYEISRVNFVRMVEGIIPTKGTFDACSISVCY